MKKYHLLLVILGMVTCTSMQAQKWSDLSQEQKMAKLQSFREDNQKYLKDSLKLNETQMEDIDNLNICYLSTLDRINRYAKTDADKEKYAKYATAARSAQLDAIMGPDKRKRFMDYVTAKLKKAKATMQ